MVEDPGIEIHCEPSPEWSIEGPLAGRVRDLVERLLEQRRRDPARLPALAPTRIRVVSSAPEHAGLGVGTQLSLAVVQMLLELSGQPDPTLSELAALSGRGRRSGVGLHGFRHGGMIVDGGRRDDEHPPPLVARSRFPDNWSILLVQPPGPRGRHGAEEVQSFASIPPLADRVTERLCRLVLLGILPALAEHDLRAFGAAVSELQRHVGGAFASLQGGSFGSPISDSLVNELGRIGLVGAGQSSWGPTLYAFGTPLESEREATCQRIRERYGLDPASVCWTRAANHGAVLARLND
jgi:beta-RFAP synthase